MPKPTIEDVLYDIRELLFVIAATSLNDAKVVEFANAVACDEREPLLEAFNHIAERRDQQAAAIGSEDASPNVCR